jgi:Family of unknown function (DUF6328)
MAGVVQARADPDCRESEEESEDRNLMGLLQELRVAGVGTRVLFGFLEPPDCASCLTFVVADL